TANAQPAVITIQPPLWPLVLLSTTLATTPSPRMTNSMVPSSSARKGGIGLGEEGEKLSARHGLVHTRLERRRHRPMIPRHDACIPMSERGRGVRRGQDGQRAQH